ncbi:MAG: hypothetical protein AB1Z98_09940 [Nannocystaceae bacterium]
MTAPILDESSLVPDERMSPPERISSLAGVLKALDSRGAEAVLRSVRDASDRDIGGYRGLRYWCRAFSEGVDRDAGLLIATRLAKQPFLDGPDGLFARAEGDQAIEAHVNHQVVVGLGYAALTDGIAVGLPSTNSSSSEVVAVEVTRSDGDELVQEQVEVLRLLGAGGVTQHAEWIDARVFVCRSGADLLAQADRLLPHLRFGDRARAQLSALSGVDPQFLQIVRHLRALDLGAREWPKDKSFSPAGSVRYSDESNKTMDDPRLGKLREFPVPEGFKRFRWRFHTKLGRGTRIYFQAERQEDGAVVLVGYVGPHLKTAKFR